MSNENTEQSVESVDIDFFVVWDKNSGKKCICIDRSDINCKGYELDAKATYKFEILHMDGSCVFVDNLVNYTTENPCYAWRSCLFLSGENTFDLPIPANRRYRVTEDGLYDVRFRDSNEPSTIGNKPISKECFGRQYFVDENHSDWEFCWCLETGKPCEYYKTADDSRVVKLEDNKARIYAPKVWEKHYSIKEPEINWLSCWSISSGNPREYCVNASEMYDVRDPETRKILDSFLSKADFDLMYKTNDKKIEWKECLYVGSNMPVNLPLKADRKYRQITKKLYKVEFNNGCRVDLNPMNKRSFDNKYCIIDEFMGWGKCWNIETKEAFDYCTSSNGYRIVKLSGTKAKVYKGAVWAKLFSMTDISVEDWKPCFARLNCEPMEYIVKTKGIYLIRDSATKKVTYNDLSKKKFDSIYIIVNEKLEWTPCWLLGNHAAREYSIYGLGMHMVRDFKTKRLICCDLTKSELDKQYSEIDPNSKWELCWNRKDGRACRFVTTKDYGFYTVRSVDSDELMLGSTSKHTFEAYFTTVDPGIKWFDCWRRSDKKAYRFSVSPNGRRYYTVRSLDLKLLEIGPTLKSVFDEFYTTENLSIEWKLCWTKNSGAVEECLTREYSINSFGLYTVRDFKSKKIKCLNINKGGFYNCYTVIIPDKLQAEIQALKEMMSELEARIGRNSNG